MTMSGSRAVRESCRSTAGISTARIAIVTSRVQPRFGNWTLPVVLENKSGDDWTLPVGESANFFRVRLSK